MPISAESVLEPCSATKGERRLPKRYGISCFFEEFVKVDTSGKPKSRQTAFAGRGKTCKRADVGRALRRVARQFFYTFKSGRSHLSPLVSEGGFKVVHKRELQSRAFQPAARLTARDQV